MVRLHIDPLDVDDPSDAQRVVDVFSAADAVDRPWHPGYPAAVVQVLATHGWDGDPDLFFLGRDADGALVAAGSAVLPTRDNLNAALVDVRVLPDHRGRGVGSALLDHLERVVAGAGRTRFFSGGPESDAGRRFAEARGYAVASVGMTRRVDLGEVSAEAVQAAYDEAAPHARAYELVRLAGTLPDELMEAYVDAVSAINDAPLDDLDVDDEIFDADRVRQYEQGQLLSGHRLYRVLARHRETGAVAGHTVVAVETGRPHLGDQHDTTVVGAHRGHRLGLLLKADMMRWLRDVEPELRMITTQNAASNAHMIAVNERLGYRVMGRSTEYQRDLPAATAVSSRGTDSVTGSA
jgi:GNAT superfamily N-acetyltransferase/RimJ/RimL family protein N-acetyltransferase